ncbi:MAG TPA: hypothetical protein VH268_13165, partial [Solirubrobacterales bacterium]|nr:hypothetical protein [Solirubrobacterales bacterium]
MSIIRPPERPRRGRKVIALLTVAATAAALVPAASSAHRGSGRHHLVFKLAGPAHQNVIGTHGIVISVRCPAEACTVVASATSSSPSIHTAKVRIRVAAGGTERLTLPLSTRDSGKLKAALEAGKKPSLTVKATAKDGFGSKVPLSLRVK